MHYKKNAKITIISKAFKKELAIHIKCLLNNFNYLSKYGQKFTKVFSTTKTKLIKHKKQICRLEFNKALKKIYSFRNVLLKQFFIIS